MKNISRKVFLSIGVLCLAVVAFATTTFAWFTLSTTANVNQFDMTIQNDSNLLIRATVGSVSSPSATGYASTVTLDATTLAGIKLSPICYDSSSKIFQYMSLDSEKNAVWNNAATTSYVEIKLEFQSNVAGTVKVSNIATTSENESFTAATSVDLVNGTAPKTTIAAGAAVTTVKACNALRTSFYDATSAGLIGSNVLHYINHTGEGQGDYAALTGQGVDDSYNAALAYYNAINTSSITVIEGKKVTKTITPILEDKTGSSAISDAKAATTIVTLVHAEGDAADVFKGTCFVRVWIDGFDADCFNAIITGKMHMAMGFQLVKTTA